MDNETISWKLIDKYFNDNPNSLVSHHLESYNEFFKTGITRIFRENNPIRFIEREDESVENSKRNECMLYLGDKDGSKIYFGKPIIYDDHYSHFMYPNDARLRNMNYGITIHYDVVVDFIYYKGDEKKEHQITLKKIFLGRFPIMIQSDLCILKNLDKNVRFNMGECRNDYGGYFIIDGKEKVIISQEKFADNMLYIRHYKDDELYSYSAEIRSVSEDTSKPIRTTSVKIVAPSASFTNNQIVVSVPNVKKPVPLFILMRALGVTSDKDIIKCCLLDLDKNKDYIDLFIPSVHDANKFFNQQTALEFIAELTKRGTVSGVLEILADYFLPHIGEMNFLDKAYFVGYMVFRLLKVYTKEEKPTDRDNFRFKRVELSGSLIYDLFREYYLIQKKDITRKIDEEYYYHKGSYKEDDTLSRKEKKEIKKKKLKGDTENEENKYKDNFISLIESNFKSFFKDRIVEQGFKKAFKGNWGSEAHTKRLGAVQDLNRLSWYTFISHLRKINLPLDASAKVVGPRLLNSSQWGFIDPIDTPDGGNIGLHKHMSISTYITSGSSSFPIIEWLRVNTPLKTILQCSPEQLSYSTKVFVNGRWVGVVDKPITLSKNDLGLVEILKLYRRNGIIPTYTSISFDYEHNEIHIYTDAGRLTRPIYYIEDGKVSFQRSDVIDLLNNGNITWEQIISGFKDKNDPNFYTKNNKLYDLFELYPDIGSDEEKIFNNLNKYKSIVDYVDTAEEEMALIAVDMESLKKNKWYTNFEIHPSLILGVMGNLIIYPEHNPVTRNSFSCGQSKQAVSVYHSNYQMRIDKMGVVLNYGQVPLVKSRYLEYINNEEQPYGVNAIVAVMCYSGYNVEDAILINEGAIQRGIFRTTYYSMYEAREESSKVSGMTNSKFANIEKNNVIGKKEGYDYSFLDDHGLIKENTELNDKIIVIGKVISNLENKDNWIDASSKTKKGQLGFVDKSFITQGEEGFNIAKVRIREERLPSIGDKMASRAGQKGTLGLIIPEQDMPYTKDGIRPDLIINPHALPSRMTIGQIVESLFGVVCATYGAFGDCTAFQVKGSNYSTYGPLLVKQGFNSTGNQVMYNGMTGEQLDADIYIGPTYYMRLKHMVKDKINYRARGPNTVLTRQPVQGRANDGGLRIGEMERDGVLAHGMSYFLNESFMVRGEKGDYYLAICNKTGNIAIYNEARNLFLSPSADGPIKFTLNPDGTQNIINLSRFGRSFSILKVPYSFKLLMQELQVMNVQMRIITDENVDQLLSMSYSDNIYTTMNVKPISHGNYNVNTNIETSKTDLKNTLELYNKQVKVNLYEPDTLKTKVFDKTTPDQLFEKGLVNTIYTVEGAVELYKKCISNTSFFNSQPNLEYGFTEEELPYQIKGPWAFDTNAALRTFDLIFNTLHNTCYLLCVINGEPYLTKLVPAGIPDAFKEQIQQFKIQNPSLAKNVEGDIKIMQCIIRQKKDSVATEFNDWLNIIKPSFPDGVYILNLTDSVILRNDNKAYWEPYTTQDTSIPKYLPILGYSGAHNFWDIPIPNFDDINVILNEDIPLPHSLYEWSEKIEKAVFRGNPTGCGTSSDTNMRIRLAEMMVSNTNYLDVGLIKTTNNTPRFDPVKGLGLIQVNALPVPTMLMEEQSKYKYIIHVDGNVAAYRLLKTMLLGSVILKVEGNYDLWVEQLLQDGVNYIKVKPDLSDLIEKIEWCKSHDEECKTIAENGVTLAKTILDKNYINDSFIKILWAVKNVINRQRNTYSPDFPPQVKFGTPDFPPQVKFGTPDFPPPPGSRLIPQSPTEPAPPAYKFSPHSPTEPAPQVKFDTPDFPPPWLQAKSPNATPPNMDDNNETVVSPTSPKSPRFRISIPPKPSSPNILEVEDNKDEEKDDNDTNSNDSSSDKSSDNKKTVQFVDKSNETKKITI
jgi:DNA-directed RNA polymerase II subunit RPB2